MRECPEEEEGDCEGECEEQGESVGGEVVRRIRTLKTGWVVDEMRNILYIVLT